MILVPFTSSLLLLNHLFNTRDYMHTQRLNRQNRDIMDELDWNGRIHGPYSVNPYSSTYTSIPLSKKRLYIGPQLYITNKYYQTLFNSKMRKMSKNA